LPREHENDAYGVFDRMDHGPSSWRLPFSGRLLASRRGPDGRDYTFFADVSDLTWSPPADFDWSRVVPGRVLEDEGGRRRLVVGVFVVVPVVAGDTIGPASKQLPVRIALVIDDRLGDLTGVDFSMLQEVAVVQLTMHDPLEKAFTAPSAATPPPEVPVSPDADSWDLDRLADAGAFIQAEAEAALGASKAPGDVISIRRGPGSVDTYVRTGAAPLELPAHLIGTSRVDSEVWSWSWGFHDGQTGNTVADQIRATGLSLQVPELTTPSIPNDPHVIARVLQASSAISRLVTPAILETNAGIAGFFLLEGATLPVPTVDSVVTVIRRVLASRGAPRDVRYALKQYAAFRQIGHGEQPDLVLLQATDGFAAVQFGADNAVSAVGRHAEQPPPKRGLFRKG
jgi:hypothetical protein